MTGFARFKRAFVAAQRMPLAFGVVALALPVVAALLLAQPEPQQRLTIAFGPWPGFDIALVGQHTGDFMRLESGAPDCDRLRLTLRPVSNQFDATRAVKRGTIDAAFTSMSDLVLNPAIAGPGDGSPLVIILIANISDGADGVLARPGIDHIDHLRGGVADVAFGAVNELILAEALDHHGLRLDEVRTRNAPNSLAVRRFSEAFASDAAGRNPVARSDDGADRPPPDAVVLWEPDLSATAAITGGRVLYRTDADDTVVIDCLVTTERALESKREPLVRFIAGWLDLQDRVRDEPEACFDIAGELLGVEPQQFAADYRLLRPGDAELNRRLLVDGEIRPRLERLTALLDQLRPGDGALNTHAMLRYDGSLLLEAIELRQRRASATAAPAPPQRAVHPEGRP